MSSAAPPLGAMFARPNLLRVALPCSTSSARGSATISSPAVNCDVAFGTGLDCALVSARRLGGSGRVCRVIGRLRGVHDAAPATVSWLASHVACSVSLRTAR
eukprot:4620346-Prymnesium_polylepis.1